MSNLYIGTPSFPQALVNRLASPFIASVGLGLASSSYFFLGNVACASIGVLPSFKSVHLEDDKKAELWAFFFEKAALQFVGTSVVSALSFFTAAALAKPIHTSSRPWLVTAGICSISILPYTLVILMPTNQTLLTARDRVVRKQSADINVQQHVDQWSKLHLARMVAGGISWGIGLATLILV